MVIVSFFTKNTPYEKEAEQLIASCGYYDIIVYPVENTGRWESNCALKSSVIRKALENTKEDILFLDADARVVRELNFEEIEGVLPKIPIWSNPWGRKGAPEVLSGTLYFPNNQTSLDLVGAWHSRQEEYPLEWDQRVLAAILTEFKFEPLPLEWCCIPDGMKTITNPYIIHTQASRRLKRKVIK